VEAEPQPSSKALTISTKVKTRTPSDVQSPSVFFYHRVSKRFRSPKPYFSKLKLFSLSQLIKEIQQLDRVELLVGWATLEK